MKPLWCLNCFIKNSTFRMRNENFEVGQIILTYSNYIYRKREWERGSEREREYSIGKF